jgi:hypothetical protein
VTITPDSIDSERNGITISMLNVHSPICLR